MHVLVLCFCIFILGSNAKSLTFNSDGTIKIVQFTDLHFETDGKTLETSEAWNDERTKLLMHSILEKEQPDLVVLTGDAIFGDHWDGTFYWFERIWKNMISPMV